MPKMANRVQETTTTGGTGTLTLAGAVTGYLTFASSFTTGNSLFYTIDNGVGEWEIGIGTLVTTGTLSRDTVIASSNSNALVNFSSGTKRVFCSAPTRSLVPDQDSKSGYVLTTDGTDPSWTQTLNSITIGNTTPASGAFTTLSASSTVSGTGFSTYLASPPAIGGSSPAAGNFTTLGATGAVTLSGGTANGVAYLNGSKVLTTGSALTFDGTNFGVGGAASQKLHVQNAGAVIGLVQNTASTADARYRIQNTGGSSDWGVDGTGTYFQDNNSRPFLWFTAGSEQMRLTSSGLEVKQSQLIGYSSYSGLGSNGLAVAGNVGIGTSSISYGSAGRGVINLGGSGGGLLGFQVGGVAKGYVAHFDSSMQMWNEAASPILFATNAIERMHLDSSGNLGLGVTPSGWTNGWKALQIGGGALSWSGTGTYTATQLSDNSYFTGSGASTVTATYIYGSTPATNYKQYNGAHYWYNAPSGAAGATILFNQAMTLTAAGNLLVGATSEQNIRAVISGPMNVIATNFKTVLSVNSTDSQAAGSGAGISLGGVFTGSAQTAFAQIAGIKENSVDSNFAGALALYTRVNGDSLYERARITAAGDLLVGGTNFGPGSRFAVRLDSLTIPTVEIENEALSGKFITFRTNGESEVGSISFTISSTAYNTSSDYRLKEGVQPIQNALSRLSQLKPSTYKWKADGSDGEGFIAHELQEVVPQAVSGEKDGEQMQGVDYGKLTPLLAAAIQELHQELQTLKAKVN